MSMEYSNFSNSKAKDENTFRNQGREGTPSPTESMKWCSLTNKLFCVLGLFVIVSIVLSLVLHFSLQTKWVNENADIQVQVAQLSMENRNYVNETLLKLTPLNRSNLEAAQSELSVLQDNLKFAMNSSEVLKEDVVKYALMSLYAILGWNVSGDMVYKYVEYPALSYTRARAYCKEWGGRLAAKVLRDPTIVSDIIERGIIKNRTVPTNPWVGFDDMKEEGIWRWSDEGAMNTDVVDWIENEPNSYGGNDEDCANVMLIDGGKFLLNDAPCYSNLNFICEVEIRLNDL